MITRIYLVTNIEGDPNNVYVGKTKRLNRKSEHIKKFGTQIDFVFIDEVNSLDRKDWEPLERYWIEQFRQWGFNIFNKNKGGGGLEKHSEETKKLISKKNLERSPESFLKMALTKKGKPAWNKGKTGVQNSTRKGVPLPSEVKDKISKNKKGKPWTPARREAQNKKLILN